MTGAKQGLRTVLRTAALVCFLFAAAALLGTAAHASGGWSYEGGSWYYYSDSGVKRIGWVYTGGSWYYLDENGVMQTGVLELEGDGTYLLTSSGAMYTGWLKSGGDWYYYDESGRKALGWQWISNDKYYFYREGDGYGGKPYAMAYSTEIDGQTIKADGTWLSTAEVNMVRWAQSYTSATSYLILVDTNACKVGVFRRGASAWDLAYFWNCAPGTSSTPTVTGVFTVQAKGYSFVAYGSRCYYYTQFYGNYLFHSVLYSPSTDQVTDGRLGMKLSHGCVRLSLTNAKWIYDNIPQSTKVVVY